jgi:hypothetical protein
LFFGQTGAEVQMALLQPAACSFVCLVSQDKAQAGRTAEQRKHALLDQGNQVRNLLT